MKLIFSLLATAVLSVWIAAPIVISNFLPEWSTRGQFGDIFGSINALFSGLAFAGLYCALRVQQDQLSLQRDELRLQREELKLQREEMAASRQELARQVEVQHALFSASTAQIAVAAYQAKIEALKLDAERRGSGGRDKQIEEIEEIARVIMSLSKSVSSVSLVGQ